jgi:tetratricopeptide (TPR) repeat protein
MTENGDRLCDDDGMQRILALAAGDAEGAVAAIGRALADFPGDARLHFLKGSLLVGLKRFIGAHQAMSRAVEIAPDYHIARFQLGFFELTSGEADAAIRTWQPLEVLPGDHWMRLFVVGLTRLIEDRFAESIASLRAGIAANDEVLPLNDDMRLIIAQCESLQGKTPQADADTAGDEVSATSFLLGKSVTR